MTVAGICLRCKFHEKGRCQVSGGDILFHVNNKECPKDFFKDATEGLPHRTITPEEAAEALREMKAGGCCGPPSGT